TRRQGGFQRPNQTLRLPHNLLILVRWNALSLTRLIALGEHDPPLAFKAAIHFDRRFCFSLAAGARTAHAPTEKRTHANRQVSDRLKSCPCICKYTCIYKFMGLILVRSHARPVPPHDHRSAFCLLILRAAGLSRRQPAPPQ